MPIRLDGPVTLRTRDNLIEGLRSDPMPEPAVDAVLTQAAQFVERLVETYGTQVAVGEVGADGSGRSDGADILADRPPRMLLYGRVQSGKTVAMILTAALCLDNGFRVVVVVTSDSVELVKQTAKRFKAIDGPRVLSGAREGPLYEWTGQGSALRDTVAGTGLVLICAKNAMHLENILDFLAEVDASAYPVLVLDDEADAATPDTTQAARAAGHPSAPSLPSTIHRRIVANEDPEEFGLSLGQQLPHSLYVPVTGTPFVLFLQNEEAKLRPTETFLLEAGDGYCGGHAFFGGFDPDARIQKPPIVLVDDDQSDFMRHKAPEGLARSIDFFILSACARAAASAWPSKGRGFKHLSHTSVRMNDHERVANLIRSHIDRVIEILNDPDAARNHFAVAHAELSRSVTPVPALDDLLSDMSRHVRQAEIIRINSEAGPPGYGPRLNFMVGGNILGRGLTINDLLVTYYIREARMSQMDTVWQHARMYGYRRAYFDHMRIYLPQRLAENFHRIHRAEEDLRDALAAGEEVERVLVQVPSRTRPTRPNALVEADVKWIRANRQQLNPEGYLEDPAAGAEFLTMLQQAGVPTQGTAREGRPTLVPMDVALELVRTVAVADDDPGFWHPEIIAGMLRKHERRMPRGCVVYVRSLEMSSATGDRTRARLGGPEINLLRRASAGTPSLAFLSIGDPAAPVGWYPTLVMPPSTPAYVFGTG